MRRMNTMKVDRKSQTEFSIKIFHFALPRFYVPYLLLGLYQLIVSLVQVFILSGLFASLFLLLHPVRSSRPFLSPPYMTTTCYLLKPSSRQILCKSINFLQSTTVSLVSFSSFPFAVLKLPPYESPTVS